MTKPKFVRTCPLCGLKWKREGNSSLFLEHLRVTHERDVDALAFYLSRALFKLLNRAHESSAQKK